MNLHLPMTFVLFFVLSQACLAQNTGTVFMTKAQVASGAVITIPTSSGTTSSGNNNASIKGFTPGAASWNIVCPFPYTVVQNATTTTNWTPSPSATYPYTSNVLLGGKFGVLIPIFGSGYNGGGPTVVLGFTGLQLTLQPGASPVPDLFTIDITFGVSAGTVEWTPTPGQSPPWAWDTTFTGSSGSASSRMIVTVNTIPPDTPIPTGSLSVNKASVRDGGMVTLTWSVN